jgi:hypothetical protein
MTVPSLFEWSLLCCCLIGCISKQGTARLSASEQTRPCVGKQTIYKPWFPQFPSCFHSRAVHQIPNSNTATISAFIHLQPPRRPKYSQHLQLLSSPTRLPHACSTGKPAHFHGCNSLDSQPPNERISKYPLTLPMWSCQPHHPIHPSNKPKPNARKMRDRVSRTPSRSWGQE